MENKISIPGKYHAVDAIKVSRWTRDAGTMLPKSPQEVLDMFASGNSVLVKGSNGVLLGHAAATAEYKDGSIEIGSIYTNKDYRHLGIGTLATKAIIKVQREKHPGRTLFALANDKSGPMFERMGAVKKQTSELSSDVWEFCKTCPKLPKQCGETFMCCDTPYDLTNVSSQQ